MNWGHHVRTIILSAFIVGFGIFAVLTAEHDILAGVVIGTVFGVLVTLVTLGGNLSKLDDIKALLRKSLEAHNETPKT